MNCKRTISVLLVCAMMTSLLTGCGSTVAADPAETTEPAETVEAATTRTVTLSDGYEVTNIPADVERIAALFGPSYERLYVLNAEDKIVMCSDFHQKNWPWSHLIYQRVNDDDMIMIENASKGLNVEEIVDQDLDVVFYWRNEEVLKALENVGLPGVPFNSGGGIDSIKNELLVYAEVLGTDEAMAIYNDYAAYFDAKLAKVTSVTSQIPESERKTVYYARSNLLTTFGMESDIIAVCQAAGGICVSDELAGGSSVDIDKEQLVAWNPDFIFVDHSTAPQSEVDSLFADSDYSTVSAVQNHNAYTVPVGTFYWDAGVQMILLVEWMAQTMYPDYFPDVDMVKELQEFYSEFYRYDLTDEQAQMILNNQDPT